MIQFPKPLIGICAFSGTGKTTLLTRLLPLLRQHGLRIGMIKHAHCSFELDTPGKDSFKLREAGAEQMVVASRNRMATITDFDDDRAEPSLADALRQLDPEHLDLVLVEGFKHEPIPKIELHRVSLGHPMLFIEDDNIIAFACDEPLEIGPGGPEVLDLNNPQTIARFILRRIPNAPRVATGP